MGKVGAIVAQVISIPLLRKGVPPDCDGRDCAPWLDRLMQIFALFMLFGLLVSFLLPETKGYTLEELAGEPPTSYNSGRNGSIREKKPKKWWNPFCGGRPAGFRYPRATYGSWGGGGGGRVGIMTSPELAAQNATTRKRSFWRRGRPNGQREERAESTSSTSNITGNPTTTTISTTNEDIIAAGIVPGWGVGWGRVDRGRPVGMDSVRLQDVGRLLIN